MSQPPQGPPTPGPHTAQPAGQSPWGPQPGAGWGMPPVGQQQAGGSWGPPPGQPGSWGAPPPWAGSGGPGGPGPDRRRTLVITASAVGALLAGLAVGLVLWLGSDGDDGSSSTASATPSSDTSAPASRPAAPSSAAGTGGFTAAPTVGTEEFIATLPADFTDCGAAELIGDGDVAAAACGPASSEPGPSDAVFLRYPDVDTLDDVFAADVAALGLEEWGEATDCTEDGYGEWVRGEITGGLLACGLTDGAAFIYWTDDEFLTEGVVSMPGETQGDVVALYGWWVENSDFVG